MNKFFGYLVIVLGLISSGLFFSAGSLLSSSGEELTKLRSQGGGTVAEAYYQEIGRYGIAYARLAYAAAFGSLFLSLGMGGMMLAKDPYE